MHLPAVTLAVLRGREDLSFGYMYLSAVLRAAGGRVRLVEAESADDFVRRFAADPTPVVGIGITTGLHRVYLSWVRKLRTMRAVHVVLGGPHATYFPQVVHEPGVDAVCIGEGEESFPEYLAALGQAEGAVPRAVAGFQHWYRGELLDGGPRAPVQRLDLLPGPDWSLFFEHNPRLARHPVKSFLASRGCPHRCTYCFNRTWNAMYRGSSRTVRFRDPTQVVEEIDAVRRRWGMRLVWFLDSNFAVSQRWLEALLPLYRQRIGLPFFCKVRPGVATDRLIDALVQAGCTAVGIGIESGDPELRRTLDRSMDNADIVRTCRAFRRRGVRVMSFNMVGIPGETYAAARRTLELNVESGVDYAMTTFLQPFPGTELARRAREQGLFHGDFDALDCSYFQPSPLDFGADPLDRRRIINLQRLLALAVSFPLVRAQIDRLVTLPENGLYLELFKTYNYHAFHRQFYRAYTLQPRG